MKSLKTILLAVTLTAGFGIFMGTTDVHADSLYTVKAGDTLSTISHQFSEDNRLIESIAKDNNILDVNMIFEGEQLTIRTTDDEQAAPTETTTNQEKNTAEEVSTETATSSEAATSAVTTSSAKEWIAQKESSGSYSATNGRYIGRYQLDASYLNGDYSEANQERVADSYVASRYGSWEAAQAFWLANGWY